MQSVRIEKDSMGEVQVPVEALYGAQTARAVQNFQISGLTAHPHFVRATIELKKACARANGDIGALKSNQAEAIVKACDKLLGGQWKGNFVVDVYQAGAGTSHNMNANEVIANLAEEMLGGQRGQYKIVNPNDHVNYGQSTNDTIPTSLRVSALLGLNVLYGQLDRLIEAIEHLSERYASSVKAGRTHLQDAVPLTFGQEFGGWASALKMARRRLGDAAFHLRELPLGGSAVGTGLGSEPGYRNRAVRYLGEQTGLDLIPAPDLFAAMWSLTPLSNLTGALRDLSLDLGKICDDIRLLSSGPRTGFGEVNLPAVQPGSSIMPGKVNPVLAEMTNMVCYQIRGIDVTVAAAAGAGQLELNVMMPLVAWNIPYALQILGNAMQALAEKCVVGITVEEDLGLKYAGSSLALVTALNRKIGYLAAAEIAKKAIKEDIPVVDAIRKSGLFTEEVLKDLLNINALTKQPAA
ncbi:MAG: aspartate ammonia-lyase [Calditrichaeota bacterium]|nr:aspartate ammonia-lyase [Calditrichota bacterium]